MRWIVVVAWPLLSGCGEEADGAPAEDDDGPAVTTSCGLGEAPNLEAGGGCCPAGSYGLPDGSCVAAGLPPDLACPPGETAHATGCCPAGTLAAPDGSCTPAGVIACAGDPCMPLLPASACPSGQMALTGETACRPVASCGSGTWGDIVVSSTTEHVDAGFAGASTGSAAAPWTTIQSAVNAASAGATIAVAAGQYSEHVTLTKGVTLWGRCPSMVSLSHDGDEVVFVNADDVAVRGVAISGSGRGIKIWGARGVAIDRVWIHDTGHRGIDVSDVQGRCEVSVSDSLVERASVTGIQSRGGDLLLQDTVVRDGNPGDSFTSGWGISAYDVGPDVDNPPLLQLRHVLVDRAVGTGITLATDAIIEDTLVRDTASTDEEWGGDGISTQLGDGGLHPSLTMRHVHVIGSYASSLIHRGGDALVESSALDDAGGSIAFANGVTVSGPTTMLVRGSQIRRAAHHGLLVAGANVTVESSVIRDTAEQPSMTSTTKAVVAFNAGPNGALTFRDCVIDNNRGGGINAFDMPLTIDHSVVRNTIAGAYALGRGVHAQSDSASSLTIKSSLLEGNDEAAVVALAVDTTIETSHVRDTRPFESGLNGEAITIGSVSGSAIRGTVIEGSSEVGVYAVAGELHIDASMIGNTVANLDGRFGDGVAAIDEPAIATVVVLSRSRIRASDRAAVSSFGARVELRDVALECQVFDLAGELSFDFDGVGLNGCGCPLADGECQVATVGLEPPTIAPPLLAP